MPVNIAAQLTAPNRTASCPVQLNGVTELNRIKVLGKIIFLSHACIEEDNKIRIPRIDLLLVRFFDCLSFHSAWNAVAESRCFPHYE